MGIKSSILLTFNNLRRIEERKGSLVSAGFCETSGLERLVIVRFLFPEILRRVGRDQ